jgi:hypothetical protein
MKKIWFLTVLIPVLFVACKSKCVEDSGRHISKDLSLKVYDEITISGPIKLMLVQDSTYSLKLSADSNIIDHIKAEVSGSKFTLELDPKKYCGTDSIVVHAGIGDLKVLKAGNHSQVTGEGIIHVKDLQLDLSDTTSLSLNLTAATLKTTLKGSSTVKLEGQTGLHEIKAKGSINLEAFNFASGIYNLDLEGVAKMNINVLNDLKVNTVGSTEIFYKGNPKNIDEKKSGMGKLEKVN